MKLSKKKVVTLFALTLLITSLLLANMNGPTSAQPSTDAIYLHGPSLTPVHMHSNDSLVPIHLNSNMTLTPVHMHYVGSPFIDPIYEPFFTEWHEVYPQFCQIWNLTSWEDNDDDQILSPNDQIDMTDEQGNVTWYHVDRITWTLILTNEFIETKFVEFKGPPYEDPIYFPLATFWHEVWPSYSNVHQIFNWLDNGNGFLDFCDFIDFGDGILWHVEDVATDLILREKIMDPMGTWWHEIYPDYCRWWNVTSWEDNQLEGDPGYGKLSPSDQIDMTDEETGNKTWYHVDRVTLALNVTLEGDPTQWMKIEMKTLLFEDMYNALKHPVDTLWHEVYPDYSNVYSLTWWDWMLDDNCNGVLDVCDYIWLYNDQSGIEERYHVENICYDIILNKKIMDPIGSFWHELYPSFCNNHTLTSWEERLDDPYSGRLSPGDQIDMFNETSGETKWYYVDRVTLTIYITINATGEPYYFEFKGPFEELYLPKTKPIGTLWFMVWPDYAGESGLIIEDWIDNCNGVLDFCDYILLSGVWCHVEDLAIDVILNEKIADPTEMWWHELYPTFCNNHQITGWTDNGDGMLSPCDTIDLDPLGPGYHVEKVTLTLYVTPELQGDPMYIELEGVTFEDIYRVKTQPWGTVWHEVYPEFSLVYSLIEWTDNCNGVLDFCDWILLMDPVGFPQLWHIEEVSIDIIVKEPVCDIAVTNVEALHPHSDVIVTEAHQQWVVRVQATVENNGTQTCNATVNAYYYNGTVWIQIASSQNVTLAQSTNATLTFNWDTTSVPYCTNYTIKANATTTSCTDTYLANDEYVNGQVRVKIRGDVDNNNQVFASDMVRVLIAFGQPSALYPQEDVDGNCQVFASDMVIILIHFGQSCQ